MVVAFLFRLLPTSVLEWLVRPCTGGFFQKFPTNPSIPPSFINQQVSGFISHCALTRKSRRSQISRHHQHQNQRTITSFRRSNCPQFSRKHEWFMSKPHVDPKLRCWFQNAKCIPNKIPFRLCGSSVFFLLWFTWI